MNNQNFSKLLLNWYREEGRDLPWSGEKNPYKIWISEIILQQTRVAQGWDYYLRFIDVFPDLECLAMANEDEVMKVWQGLGYYSRARNLHKAAKKVFFERGGKFPQSFEDLLSLPGIGKYTAAAIASFAFGEAVPVIDGNVYRVLSRVFLVEEPIDVGKSFGIFFTLAKQLIDLSQPGQFNQAIMDFGSLVCKPLNPVCSSCPMREECQARKKDRVEYLPIKVKKIEKKNRFLHFVYALSDSQVFLEKRTDKGIWQGLYQFPLVEAPKALLENEVKKEIEEKYGFKINSLTPEFSGRHELTHQSLYISIYQATISPRIEQGRTQISLISTNTLHLFAFPKPLASYIQKKV